jgi:hypothetical protein
MLHQIYLLCHLCLLLEDDGDNDDDSLQNKAGKERINGGLTFALLLYYTH